MKRLFAALALACASLCAFADTPVTAAQKDVRGTEQTYLTFPEWYLVFSPDEYATFVQAKGRPSDFPFMGHVNQFWSAYRAVGAAANDGYPFNFGYHVMIMVIGTSTTVEYALREAYETMIGRVAEATAGGANSEEDRFAAQAARDYVDFIVVRPWYEFDFKKRLGALWSDVPMVGPHMIRKWERRYALTTEYGIKALYGWMIEKATRASYDTPLETTAVVVSRGGEQKLEALPRYQAFTDAATKVSMDGGQIVEVAGNRTVILMSLLAPRDWKAPASETFLEQPVMTRPEQKRVLLRVPVASLSERLRTLPASGVKVEHVFDY